MYSQTDGPLPTGYLVLFGGQSNMLGHYKAVEGQKPSNDRVFAWSNEGSSGGWRRAELGTAPFNQRPGLPNNPALHFADHLQKDTGRPVYLVGLPVNGSTLLSWSSGGAENMARLVSELKIALETPELRAAKINRVDSFLWSQGESDDIGATMVNEEKLTTLDSYRSEFQLLISYIVDQPWWSQEVSKFLGCELMDNGWLSARNDFYRDRKNWPTNCVMDVVSSVGLDDVGDKAHYNGYALEEIGARMFELRMRLAGASNSDSSAIDGASISTQ